MLLKRNNFLRLEKIFGLKISLGLSNLGFKLFYGFLILGLATFIKSQIYRLQSCTASSYKRCIGVLRKKMENVLDPVKPTEITVTVTGRSTDSTLILVFSQHVSRPRTKLENAVQVLYSRSPMFSENLRSIHLHSTSFFDTKNLLQERVPTIFNQLICTQSPCSTFFSVPSR